MRQLSFKRHRLPPEIIRHSIWLYSRFNLRFRDVEEMLAERVLDISYETIRRWFLKFGSAMPPIYAGPAQGPAITGTSTNW
jgi:putative transposase